MNTVEKGNILEKNAINIIKSYIEQDYFGPRDCISLKTKVSYPTKIRNGSVEFDLSVEFKIPGQQKPSLTYFIECKNYKGRLPADKIKKFKADIEEVSGINSKGIIISSSELQRGAYEYAEAYGIMVLVGENLENHKIILPRKSSLNLDKIPFIKGLKPSKDFEQGLAFIEKQIDKAILSAFVFNARNVSFGIDKLSKFDINEISKNELNKIGEEYLIKAYGVEPKFLIPFLKSEYNLDVEYSNIENLGQINLDKNLIQINQRIKGTSRELFVLAHEYGHFILHQNLSINNQLFESFSDTIKSFKKATLKNPKQWIEWQANYFASSFIMPKHSITAILWRVKLKMDLPKGNLIINDGNQNQVNEIIKKIAYHFNCSKQSVIIRLQELNLIEDRSNLRHIGSIIPEII